jgi:ABC-type multidrug transport system permease subunit
MEMESYADTVVGVPGEGLNVEQRKRLTIAVEMAAEPELVLFLGKYTSQKLISQSTVPTQLTRVLDEPTSGLDSQTAWSICTLLRKLADNGQTILCTIHQPSSQLFSVFDRLLLLDRGGTTLYFGDIGPDSFNLTEYFETNGAPECQGQNPAEWMLEITGNENESHSQQEEKRERWSETWNTSQQRQLMSREVKDLKNLSKTTTTPSEKATQVSLLQQFIVVSKRIFQEQWRDPTYLYSKFALSSFLALANGISFYHQPLQIQGLTSILFSIFLVTQMFSNIDRLVIPRLEDGLQLFESRERDSGLYSWIVLITSNILIEMFWQTLISVLVFVCWYYPTGLQYNGDAVLGTAERGGLAFVLICLFNLWGCTLSQAFAVGIRRTATAEQMATLCFWLTVVFCGFVNRHLRPCRYRTG